MAKVYQKQEIANILSKMSDLDKLFLVIMMSNKMTLEKLSTRLTSLTDRKDFSKFKADWFAATLRKSYYEQLISVRAFLL